MADHRFFKKAGVFRFKELADLTRSSLGEGVTGEEEVYDVAAADEAGPGQIAFIADIRQGRQTLENSKAGFCILQPAAASAAPAFMKLLLNENPAQAFLEVIQCFYPRIFPEKSEIHPRASVAETAKIGKNCRIGAGAVIGEQAKLGEECEIGPNAVIGDGVILGNRCRIGANASVANAEIGNNVTLAAGVRIGESGFGYLFAPDKGHQPMPHVGRVILHDNVEIGANSTVDRGMLSDTIIGKGTKIDNFVQVAHNAKIGEHVILVAHVGVSGSCTVKDYAVLGGRVGLADHVTIGRGARVAAGAGLMHDVPDGETWCGYPAVPIKQFFRQTAILHKLANPSKKKES